MYTSSQLIQRIVTLYSIVGLLMLLFACEQSFEIYEEEEQLYLSGQHSWFGDKEGKWLSFDADSSFVVERYFRNDTLQQIRNYIANYKGLCLESDINYEQGIAYVYCCDTSANARFGCNIIQRFLPYKLNELEGLQTQFKHLENGIGQQLLKETLYKRGRLVYAKVFHPDDGSLKMWRWYTSTNDSIIYYRRDGTRKACYQYEQKDWRTFYDEQGQVQDRVAE